MMPEQRPWEEADCLIGLVATVALSGAPEREGGGDGEARKEVAADERKSESGRFGLLAGRMTARLEGLLAAGRGDDDGRRPLDGEGLQAEAVREGRRLPDGDETREGEDGLDRRVALLPLPSLGVRDREAEGLR